jgi:hypothetical protein
MTRSELVIGLIRLFGIVALGACGLFLLLIWGADSAGADTFSYFMQRALDISTIALVVAAGLQVLVALPLWLIPKFRRSHG